MEFENEPGQQSFPDEEYRASMPPPPPTQEPPVDNLPPLKPNNWLWQSIVATIFCCLPFGIVGIVYAAKVDSLYFNGKYEESERFARKAKTWTLTAVVLGLVYLIIWMVMLFTGNLPEYMENIIENNASGYNF